MSDSQICLRHVKVHEFLEDDNLLTTSEKVIKSESLQSPPPIAAAVRTFFISFLYLQDWKFPKDTPLIFSIYVHSRVNLIIWTFNGWNGSHLFWWHCEACLFHFLTTHTWQFDSDVSFGPTLNVYCLLNWNYMNTQNMEYAIILCTGWPFR